MFPLLNPEIVGVLHAFFSLAFLTRVAGSFYPYYRPWSSNGSVLFPPSPVDFFTYPGKSIPFLERIVLF